MKVAVVKETFPGERRVALVPGSIADLVKAGLEVIVQSGAGCEAGSLDQDYVKKGALIVNSREEAFAADIILQVRSFGANSEAALSDLPLMRAGQVIIGMSDPLGNAQATAKLAETGVTSFALEMIPRITRAQSMDVLSSMASIAGYRAVLLGAVELSKIFPMMMTAAGTLKAARVFVIGAGVAGLQAIATAKRLGGIVQAYDVRPDCREQVESLGGSFVEMQLETEDAETSGGYAKEMDEDFYRRQRELMASVVAQSDVVVTTAAIPGRQSPLLITTAAVDGMAPGSVIIDMAAERGGNCEPSEPDQRIVHNGVVILGPTNLPAEVPNHTSQMFSNNVIKFLLNMVDGGELKLDMEDEIVRDTLATQNGEVVHARLRDILKMQPLAAPEPEEASDDTSSETDNADSGTIPFDDEDSESAKTDSNDTTTQEDS